MANRQREDQDLFIGIDLGDTKISTALVDREGQMISRDYRETKAAEGPDAVVARMVDAASKVMNDGGVISAQAAKIVPARLGDDVGVLGAAAVAMLSKK